MEKKDAPIIIFVAAFAVIISIVIGNIVFNSAIKGKSVLVVPSLSSNFYKLSSRYYNKQSSDYTVFIQTGPISNTSPFSSSSN